MNEQTAIKKIIIDNKSSFTKKTEIENIYKSNELIELEFPSEIVDSFDDLSELLYNNTQLILSYSFYGSMTSSTTNICFIEDGSDLLYLHLIDDLSYVIGYSKTSNNTLLQNDFIKLLLNSNGELFNTQLIGEELPSELFIGNPESMIKELFFQLIIKEGLWSKIPDKIIDENAPKRIRKVHYKQKDDFEIPGYEIPYHDELTDDQLRRVSSRLFNYLKN
jgi:hypothetical protein